MEFITKNLKQAGIFNTILIVGGMVYDIVRIFRESSVYSTIAVVLQLIAYCFALNYAFRGYKKDAAKSYKMFLYAFILSMIATMVSVLIHGKAPMHSTVLSVIRLVCVSILAFTNDLGKTKSYLFSAITFIVAVISLVWQISNGVQFGRLYSFLSALVLSAVLCVFVVAKYSDKESRGAK